MDMCCAPPVKTSVGKEFSRWRKKAERSRRMIFVILLALLQTASARSNGEESKYRTAYACEGRQLRISCEPGHMIHLLRANYGRFSISICNEHGNLDWSVDCTSPNSFNVIKDTCGMKNSCSLSASPSLFGDPCPGTPKYLEAHYQCVPEKSSVTPSTSTTTSTSSSTSTSRPSIIIPVTPNRNARPHHVAPPSAPPSPSTTPAGVSLGDATSEAATVASATTTVTTLLVDVTTTLADSLLMMLSGTPETSTSEPSTVHLSRWSPDNREDDPQATMSCFPTEARGLFWNWTRAGHVALHRCPGGGTGRVKWRCDAVTVQWVPESPDFSDCSSQWVENIKYRMSRGDPITSLAAELAVITRTKALMAGDIVHSADILHRLVTEMGERTRVMDDPQQRQRVLLALLESVLAVSSNLLDDSQRLPWHDLNREQQQKSASALLRSQEKSGWLLAESHHSRYSLRSGQPHVLAAVHVVESWDISDVVLPPPLDTTWWRVDDRLLVPAPALLATAKQGVSRLVLLVHHRLGDLLGSEVHTTEPITTNASRVINSRVIGALLEGHRVLSLPRPITVTFKHLQVENVSNPLCVFWDYQIRSWSTEGCWLKYTNQSHTVCQCNHLTNLAIIMHVTETQDQPLTTDHETLRMIVYIGCAVTMVFLLITLLVLQFIRCLRTERVTIHKHLCLCLLLAEAALIGGLEQTEEPKACSVLAGFLHYLLLAAFAWAFLDSFHLYILLGETDIHPDRWRVKWYSCVAYGIPLIVVAISALIDPASYGTDNYCWLRVDNYYVFSFGGPAIACALASILFLCMTVGRICAQRNSTAPMKSKDQTKLSAINVWSGEATVLLLVLCSTWTLLPLFLHDEKPLTAYFFLGLNILQGLLVFLFYCLNAGKVQSSDEPPGPDWLCSCLREPPRRRSLYSPPGSCPHNYPALRWSSLEQGEVPTLRCATSDRHFGSRSCEEHPLQYLLRTSEPQRPWGIPDPIDNRTLCCYHQDRHSPHHLKHEQQQLQAEPHYETLEPLEGPPRPLFSSLAAVLNMGPTIGVSSGSPCRVAYCGIQSPTDSDRSSSSFMDTHVRMSPAASSPDNDLTDSLPNLDRRTGCGASSLPASLTY
ncbi:latrophilin Cirl-like isoform X3 [Argiope bruennichi]|nr:latrophilin Cirl-like isoform X3 [Argiope bruennichi]XP_055935856.1 latrophilin Cirl-like isoform X3 [Argiope bruennichi]XP_055935857.1 latrophilin Cirl-like isoform X3 [Argiope bruennichi]XP_055935858.1 latrophilin Cirl-like isoform X3 [Argiope bruennichi]XP_055935860.1 latrophilin Cirl-like isoform X3 [Argiope bruennichi]